MAVILSRSQYPKSNCGWKCSGIYNISLERGMVPCVSRPLWAKIVAEHGLLHDDSTCLCIGNFFSESLALCEENLRLLLNSCRWFEEQLRNVASLSWFYFITYQSYRTVRYIRCIKRLKLPDCIRHRELSVCIQCIKLSWYIRFIKSSTCILCIGHRVVFGIQGSRSASDIKSIGVCLVLI